MRTSGQPRMLLQQLPSLSTHASALGQTYSFQEEDPSLLVGGPRAPAVGGSTSGMAWWRMRMMEISADKALRSSGVIAPGLSIVVLMTAASRRSFLGDSFSRQIIPAQRELVRCYHLDPS